MEEYSGKRTLYIVIGVIVLLILCIVGYFAFFKKDNKKVEVKENDKVEENLPFVEKNEIELLSTTTKYENPIFPYITDDKNNYVASIDTIFNKTNSSYEFYDLKVENDGDTDIYTFKIKVEVPIEYITYNEGDYIYTYSTVLPTLFDYYTGECYKEGIVSLDNSMIGMDVTEKNKEMKYTDITWDGKTYQIGVLKEITSSWDGNKVIGEQDGQTLYGDTSRSTIQYTVKTPKDYNGVLVEIYKRGSTRDSFEKYLKRYKKYMELLKEAEENGYKSDELLEMENTQEKVVTLFESTLDTELKYTKDDFYVFRVNSITKQ